MIRERNMLSAVVYSFAVFCLILFVFGHRMPAKAADDIHEWDEVLEKYNEYLSQETIFWTGTEGIGLPVTEQMQFLVEDINSDCIPELMVKNTEDVYGLIEIYTHGEFGVIEVVSCDELGGYYPGTPVFYTRTDHRNINEDYLYLDNVIDDIAGWSLKVAQIYEYESGTEYYWFGVYSDDTADKWYDNGALEITKEDFDSKLKTLVGDTRPVDLSEAEWHDNTKENRKQYLG